VDKWIKAPKEPQKRTKPGIREASHPESNPIPLLCTHLSPVLAPADSTCYHRQKGRIFVPRQPSVTQKQSSSVRAKDVLSALLQNGFEIVRDAGQTFNHTAREPARKTRGVLQTPDAKLSTSGDSVYLTGVNPHSKAAVTIFIPVKGMMGEAAVHRLQSQTGVTFPKIN
jgi:hypothetical protein